MAEYIEREAVIKEIAEVQDKSSTGFEDVAYYRAIQIIREQPTSDVQPVKRGYWKTIMMSEGTGWDLSYTGGRDEVLEYNCSVCGKANILDEFGEDFLPPYCPFCGADLRED